MYCAPTEEATHHRSFLSHTITHPSVLHGLVCAHARSLTSGLHRHSIVLTQRRPHSIAPFCPTPTPYPGTQFYRGRRITSGIVLWPFRIVIFQFCKVMILRGETGRGEVGWASQRAEEFRENACASAAFQNVFYMSLEMRQQMGPVHSERMCRLSPSTCFLLAA